jgi:hypothetical protein
MPTDKSQNAGQDALQFDRVDPGDATPGADAGLVCTVCKTPLRTQYYHVAEQPACATCKEAVERSNQAAAAQVRSPGTMARAFLFGLGAAIAGAILYYGVIEITGWEIGLVAIVIGFMVGWAVQKATRNVGGRRYQILAVVLTYFAVGLAYTPFALKSSGSSRETAALADSALVESAANVSADSGAEQSGAAAASASADTTAAVGTMAALGYTFLFVFILPVLYIAGSMPSGLISAVIILFGMLQAWKMTARTEIPISGPYRVGAPAPEPAA